MHNNTVSSLYNKYYRSSFVVSLSLHFLLLIMVIYSASFTYTKKINLSRAQNLNKQPKEMIKAITVNQNLVTKEVARLNKLDSDKKQQELKRQQKLKNELAKVKKQKDRETKKLAEVKKLAAKLRVEQEKLKKEKAAINKDSNRIQKELETKRAEKLKVEQELSTKLAQKQQQELMEKLKREQQQALEESLAQENELLQESRRRTSLVEKEIERYISMQQAKVSRNWIARESFLGKGLITKLEIRLDNDGRVISVKIVKPSGDSGLDQSARNAVLKASPLPVPKDKEMFKSFNEYRFTFRPDELS